MNEPLTKQERYELRMLILQSVDGMLSKDGIDRMETILKSSKQARRYYREYIATYCSLTNMMGYSQIESDYDKNNDSMQLDGILKSMLEQESTAPAVEVEKEEEFEPIRKVNYQDIKQTERKKVLWPLFVSAAAIFLFMIFLKVTEPTNQGTVAQLTRIVNAQWSDVRGGIEVGCDLSPGPMNLKNGLAEITFSSGAVVVVEGPCKFELEGDSQILLQSGSVVADIESSVKKHFVVQTPCATITDHGTEFGVNVDQAGNTQTYVFKGCVELSKRADKSDYASKGSLWLDAGNGGKIDHQGFISEKGVDETSFTRKEEFNDYVLADKGSGYHRWKIYNRKLQRDPSLIAHYTFEKDINNQDKLVNYSPNGKAVDGILGGDRFDAPKWVEGRWSNKTALGFDADRNTAVFVPASEKLSLTGELTVSAWFKSDFRKGRSSRHLGHIISSRNNEAVNSSLFFATARNGYDSYKPKIQTWFIRRSDSQTQIKSHRDDEGFVVDSRKWHLVNVTHDNKTVRFYIDGRLVSEKEYQYDPISITADMVIGNSVSGTDIRKFDGLIGEIAMFSRVLSLNEIEEMYQAGKE